MSVDIEAAETYGRLSEIAHSMQAMSKMWFDTMCENSVPDAIEKLFKGQRERFRSVVNSSPLKDSGEGFRLCVLADNISFVDDPENEIWAKFQKLILSYSYP